jgi:hypothetical protein
MQLIYANTTHTQIVAHLDAGEQLGNLGSPDVAISDFIKVDGNDENYKALLEQDPFLVSVIDPAVPPAGEVAPMTQAQANAEKAQREFEEQRQEAAQPAQERAPAARRR